MNATQAQIDRWLSAHNQGFADSRHAGTRYGVVHLFRGSETPLCGRTVKRWNFEGDTSEDFCPRCYKHAMSALSDLLTAKLTPAQTRFLAGPVDGALTSSVPHDVWFPLFVRGEVKMDFARGAPRLLSVKQKGARLSTSA